MKNISKTFISKGDFAAFYLAEIWLKNHGFSLGSMQRDDPIGVMYGEYTISKWRHLNDTDRALLHGQLTGDKRNGPVILEIFGSAPEEAVAAALGHTRRGPIAASSQPSRTPLEP